MTAKVRSIFLEIDHQQLSLRTDRDEALLQELATYLNEQIRALRKAAPRVPTQQLYLLVALQLADELSAEKDKASALGQALLTQGQSLLALIDQELDPGGSTEHDTPAPSPESNATASETADPQNSDEEAPGEPEPETP